MTDVRLFLVRHGRTSLNAAGLLRGELDVPLDPTGEAEAAAVGRSFGEVRLDLVVSSPLTRAVDTARALVAASGLAPSIDERLKDRSYGEWAGKAPADLERRFGSVDRAPGVEPWSEVESRALAAVGEAILTAGHKVQGPAQIAIVTHEAILRALLGRVLGTVSPTEIELPTGCWSELDRSELGHWKGLHLGESPDSPVPRGSPPG